MCVCVCDAQSFEQNPKRSLPCVCAYMFVNQEVKTALFEVGTSADLRIHHNTMAREFKDQSGQSDMGGLGTRLDSPFVIENCM